MNDVVEKIADLVAPVRQNARRKCIEGDRAAIEDMIYDIREWSAHGYESWSFDMDMDKAVDRVRKFLEDRI